jgi:hypothetical protein
MARGKAKRYYVVDQVQNGLWTQVGYFYHKRDAEDLLWRLSGTSRIVRTFPSGYNHEAKFTQARRSR